MDDIISLDYYEGTYGPVIRISTHSVDNLSRIRYTVIKLKDGVIKEFHCSEWENVKISGFEDLILMNSFKERKWLSLNIETSEGKMGGPVFIWKMNSTDWYNCEGYIDGLIENQLPGTFQILLESNIDIELHYR